MARRNSALSSWDDAYRTSPPWDIGRPQPAIVDLLRNGELRPGTVLDVGCGTGENALFLAQNGFEVVGVDIVKGAIETARAKAESRNIEAEFQVGNALSLKFEKDRFVNIIDCGLFHTFSDSERTIYGRETSRVTEKGGNYFMLCFSEKEPTNWGGPRRVTRREIEQTFRELFRINYINDILFTTRIHDNGGRAYLTSATKL